MKTWLLSLGLVLFPTMVFAQAKGVTKPGPAPSLCYLQVSEKLFAASQECSALTLPECNKRIRDCKFDLASGKCLGYLANMCRSIIPSGCEKGIEVVASFPAKLPADAVKFKCKETSPMKVNRVP